MRRSPGNQEVRDRLIAAAAGTLALARRLKRRIAPRSTWPPLKQRLDLFAGKRGLEIGGPSEIFGRHDYLPLYGLAGSLDGCNFSRHTTWQIHAADGGGYCCDGRIVGRQYISEATDLAGIADGAYDFVLASHVLEHTANPLKALCEWRRVLKPEGAIIVVVPERRATFDHRRPVTGFDHLVHDFEAGTGEDDLTHLDEILALHDLSRDRAAGSPENFARRSRDNHANRCLHHHVFDQDLLCRALVHGGFEVLGAGVEPPFHITALARRTG